MSKMMETENNGDLRRGAKQTKQSGHKLISDKSCKERTKKLSAVNRASWRNEKYEMACVVADREESFHSQSPSLIDPPSKKFKLPRKQIFDDYNGVDHVSVPRKLRSAMKKRNGESSSSLFPDSKKFKYSGGGVKSPKKVGIKRSKLNLKQGGPNCTPQQGNGPITKDEEEVVETLYALAGMFPDSEPDTRSKKGIASLDANSLALAGPPDSHAHKIEALEEDLNSHCLSKTEEAVNLSSDVERLPENINEACSLNGPSIPMESNFSYSEELLGLDNSSAHVKLNKMLDMHEEQKPLRNSVNFCFPLEPYQNDGKVKQLAKVETSVLETKPEIALGLTTTFGQLNQPHKANEPRKNASWTSSSSTLSSTCHGPLSQSCAAKLPAWFGIRPGLLQNDSSIGTVSKAPTDQRSQKKCASHIYISRLIKSLQKPDSKESLELLPNKLKPVEILTQGVPMTINDFSSIKNDIKGVASPSSIVEATNDTKSGNLQHLRIQQDHSQADLASGAYTSQKQSFNFLSLAAGGGKMESNMSYSRVDNRPESMATLQIPYQAQNPALVPFSMYQTRGTSAYPLQPSAAAQQGVQVAPNLGSAYFGPQQASPKALTKQQQVWASQLGQYWNSGMQFPYLQNGRQDSAAMIPCAAPSPQNVELLGPNYPHISHYHQLRHQQQQQQYVGFSLQHGRLKRQDSHIYEETEVGFRAGGTALPMQLLCNERL